jgi:putative ABC transport system permease protein
VRGLRTIGHGVSELRAHPWRAFLSGVSLCVGVLSVVAIFTIGSITQEVFVAVAEQHDGRRITVSGKLTLPNLTPGAVRDALAGAPSVTENGGGATLLVRVPYRTGLGRWAEAQQAQPLDGQPITLVAGRLDSVKRLPLLAGRRAEGWDDFPVELTLNQTAAARWGGPGTRLSLLASADQPPVLALVVGVVADGLGESSVYVSLPALLHVRPAAVGDNEVQVLLHHPDASVTELRQVAEAMARAGRGTLTDHHVDRVDHVEELLGQLRSQQQAFLAVAFLALAISALGILNIGLASVGERARELVIRRAIGATRREIIGQMLVASLLVGLVATGAACALAAVGVLWWVPTRIDPMTAIEPPNLPWNAAAWGALAAALTSLAGSLIPALVASRLDVATALRD